MQLQMESQTSLSPEEALAALTDFSPRRPQMWTGISPQYYEVYEVGETSAVIREGTKRGGLNVWAKEHYDWSQPGTVTWTVKESNFCTPGSYVKAEIRPRAGGCSAAMSQAELPVDRHIETRGISKSFGGTRALSNASVSVRSGSFP